MMRNLIDIVEDVKDGKKPDYEELRYALLAYVFMFNIDHRQLREELTREENQPKFLKDMRLKSSFDMYKNALNTPPKKWLGWANDPDNPDYQRFRRAGNKLLDDLLGAQGGNDDDGQED